MILENYETFIKGVLDKLGELKIDVSGLNMDHIGYQASSNEDYDNLKAEFDKLGQFVSEKIVGGRRVGIYKLNNPFHYHQYTNMAIELVAPKEGQVCPSALEHVEFVIGDFESFMKKYLNISWDISAIGQPDFPMIKLRLDKDIQVKFHLTPVLEIIRAKKEA
ncbi:VOC family protein [Candidatus Collierbacteria bacterium]|nr:VOC family protein [Candidatus Collierbacteria bacterium]